jgi:hypothetical protein
LLPVSIHGLAVRLTGKEDVMEYLLMIYNEEKRFRAGSDPEVHKAYRAFGEEFKSHIKGGNALQPTTAATSVRVREGKRLTTDGPFAETKEQLGGYYLIEAADLDQALTIAANIPGAKHGTIEVRPIMKVS